MATLVLQVAGSALGGAIGGPFGAIIGRAIGGLAGAAIDTALFSSGGGTRYVEGPRLNDVQGLTSTEGAGVPRVYGRARVGGQLIWATRLEEVAHTSEASAGGGKLGGGGSTVTTNYSYFANLAVGLCEGPIAFVRRVWADGRELDQSGLVMRVHQGHEDQEADPLIVAKEGIDNAPRYRGLAYVVFERLPLEDFGNRIPQFSFEVLRPVAGLAEMVRAVDFIPGASEFIYEPQAVSQVLGPGVTRSENRHQLFRPSDVVASLDVLQALCPNLERIALVVSWFGDDLRAGHCTITPRVETYLKTTEDLQWQVAGLDRMSARQVSQLDARPAYGGTPSDSSVIDLIREIKARGLKVVLYPFVMMDLSPGNDLPNPYADEPGQPAFPWRGRITCHPAPGQSGSPDGTDEAGEQVAQLFGEVLPGHFMSVADTVIYAGPDEWSLRRQVLHYAYLAMVAGGVDGFIIGSELVGLTRVRRGAGLYPAVEQLVTLAADVRSVVGLDTKILYAADWTEYGAHVREGGEVRFPLDPLWASAAIDAVGIDFYPPFTDWRDGTSHRDAAEAYSIYDPDYLKRRITAGEAFDWYYASDADRDAQIRTPITDGDYGKPWIHRAKDLAGWWQNPHVERVGGVETGETAWVPCAKPIWLTEIGIPAVDKGTNGPNVFPDPKSSESAYPPYSRRVRDDLIQNRALEALIGHYGEGGEAANPVSPLYGGPMVDPAGVFVWAWDARPFPAFPDQAGTWADGTNWQSGHWLTGRLEGLPLDRLVAQVLDDFALPPAAALAIDGFLDGYVVERPMSVRAILEPLASAYGFDAVASGPATHFRGTGRRPLIGVEPSALVPDDTGAGMALRRAQETDLPCEYRIGFTDGDREYRRSAAASRRLSAGSAREQGSDLAVITGPAEAQRLADLALQDAWISRETLDLGVSPRMVGLEPGDLLDVPVGGGRRIYQIQRITDGLSRRVSLRAIEPTLHDGAMPDIPRHTAPSPPVPGRPAVVILDLPIVTKSPPMLQHMAVAADPWPGRQMVWRSADGTSFVQHTVAPLSAAVGETWDALPHGPLWRWDKASSLTVRLWGGALASVDDTAALAGANSFALRGPDGLWEILSAARAELIGDGVYRLSRLLRGLGGSEEAAGRPAAAGATIVRLDRAIFGLTDSAADLGRNWHYRVGPVGRDHGDPIMRAVSATVGPLALMPFAPVHIRARRIAGGIAITFIRRSRIDGDAWEAAEIPLGEEAEAYEVDIFDGATVRRRLTTGSPAVLYPAADELDDFGSAQTTLTLVLAQMSTVVGRGFETRVTVPIL
ncbi:Putative tail protein [Hyphomicrobiales bacterium]|nr:putative tail protein [Hyphomicrobiales bacterium]CAH1669655.1 Putative tail protein [Hyphomicrobiales bacterium]